MFETEKVREGVQETTNEWRYERKSKRYSTGVNDRMRDGMNT